MQDEFALALPQLVPSLVNDELEQDEGQLEKALNQDPVGFDGLDESDDEGENMVLRVRTALLDVKRVRLVRSGSLRHTLGPISVPI